MRPAGPEEAATRAGLQAVASVAPWPTDCPRRSQGGAQNFPAQADEFAQALDAERKKQAALVKAKAVALAEADAKAA